MKWKRNEIEKLKQLKLNGFTQDEISRRLKKTKNSIKMKICRLGKCGELKLKKHIYDDTFTFDYVNENDMLKNMMIWICEGTAYKLGSNQNRIEVVNSDPRIIYSFIEFLRKIRINEDKIRLRLKCSVDEDKTLKKFWSNILKVPISQFLNSSRPVVKNSQRKNDYGILTLRYNSGKLSYELYKRSNDLLNLKISE